MGSLLQVRQVSLAFGGLKALDGVDLEVRHGSVSAVIGPNGAGKTCLLNCMCGYYRPQSGSILLGSTELLRCKPNHLVATGLARTFQHVEVFPGLTVLEHALLGAHSRGRPNALAEALRLPVAVRTAQMRLREIHDLMALLGLKHHEGALVQNLSLGIQKRVGLARALASHPRLVLLDEPASGLNPAEKHELIALVQVVKAEFDLTVLLIEHDMDLVMGLCDDVTVLDAGRRIASGPPALIRNDPNVAATYLGPMQRPPVS